MVKLHPTTKCKNCQTLQLPIFIFFHLQMNNSLCFLVLIILKALRIYWAPFKTFDLEIDCFNPSLGFCIKVYFLFKFCKKVYYFSNEINFWSLFFFFFFLDGMQECQMFKWMTSTDFFSQARCMHNRCKCSLSDLRYVRFFSFFVFWRYISLLFLPSIVWLSLVTQAN